MKDTINSEKSTVKFQKKVIATIEATKKKGKTGFAKIVFSRMAIIILSLLCQAALLFGLAYWLTDYYAYITLLFSAFALILVVFIINKDSNPMYQMAWIILILALPVFGSLLYLFVKAQISDRLIRKRLDKLAKDTMPYLQEETEIENYLKECEPSMASLSQYLYDHAGFPIENADEIEFYPLGENKFDALIREIKNAKKFIFMEYFIVEAGVMWDTILALLIEKVQEGVEVRFMYDGMCSFTLLPYNYAEVLKNVGIKAKVFNQIRPALSTCQNNRDHRKIVVIDGKVGFTGGVNLADEYINTKERFGHWKDTGIMIKGAAVRNFTMMFLQLWNIDERTPEKFENYLAESDLYDHNCVLPQNGFVCPYGDSPFDEEYVGEQVYLHMLYNATKYVHIMTPYLIIGPEMEQALEFAAKRGVDVKLLLPHIPDKKYAFWLARTYYADLIGAGVKIYEYTPGFVHAKEMIVDDQIAVLGTINLDYRSLFLHFECGVLMYKHKVIYDMEHDYTETLKVSQQMTLKDVEHLPKIEKICGRILRLIAPLM